VTCDRFVTASTGKLWLGSQIPDKEITCGTGDALVRRDIPVLRPSYSITSYLQLLNIPSLINLLSISSMFSDLTNPSFDSFSSDVRSSSEL